MPFSRRYFKLISLNENVQLSIKISLKFVPRGPINNISALVQIMAWRWPGDKPLSELMVASLLTHIHITRPLWVNQLALANWPQPNFMTWATWVQSYDLNQKTNTAPQPNEHSHSLWALHLSQLDTATHFELFTSAKWTQPLTFSSSPQPN